MTTSPTPTTRTKVLLVDDHDLIRKGLRHVFERDRQFEVVGEAATAAAAIELAEQHRPDLLLIETWLPDQSGADAIREIIARSPRTSVVVLATETDQRTQLTALRAGAVGYLHKAIDIGLLPGILRGVLAGEAAISRSLTRVLVEQVRALESNAAVRLRPVKSLLTQREWEVLDLLSQGASTAMIMRELDVSEGTVRTHVKHVLRKLGLHSRKEAIRYVRRVAELDPNHEDVGATQPPWMTAEGHDEPRGVRNGLQR
jgi:DNA-binding NarL/FixJ family response regulator